MISYGNGKQGTRPSRMVQPVAKPAKDPEGELDDAAPARKRGIRVVVDGALVFPSIKSAASYMRIHPDTLRYNLRKGPMAHNGRTACFIEDIGKDIVRSDVRVESAAAKVSVVFPSVVEAAACMRIAAANLRYNLAAHGTVRAGGFTATECGEAL